mmetsp:Transcript_16098/g.30934  ORF Transcript_16098/g.30934 Transcript_16098/m.30934 type:complete len:493 (-) Transcript_16098:272-1750(-)|eukprot:CAMPEP_0114260174 /NCGR_PEP_ID=MMETSP0058-20121206/20322_1 /TAXON_ID=36894 /ORGANISM="Pyramimonas parkeae, CCMP726" /LENGTH=492 /DNA_ID=CAMNT_0001375343 /DNA_START=215 /DNA_END=1693 /DNA_ORIENTATION=+
MKLNHNVKMTYLVCLVYGVSSSVWNGTVLVSFLYTISGGSNAMVGYTEAAQGLSRLVTALPVGYFADKFSRSGVISVGGVLSFATVALMIFTVVSAGETAVNTSLYSMTAALCVWGLVDGVVWGPMQALFADSTPTGSRTTYYTIMFSCFLVASAVGPGMCVVLFIFLGDVWSLSQLKVVMLVGLGLKVPASVCLLYFKDEKALSEPEPEPESKPAEPVRTQKDKTDAPVAQVEGGFRFGSSASLENMDSATPPASPSPTRCAGLGAVPYILFASSFVSAIATGMTTKFFPLFFKNDVHMSPASVQGVYVVSPVALALCIGMAMTVSKSMGRVPTMLLFRGIGVAVLFAMVHLERYSSIWWVMVPLYIVRTALVDCTFAIQESLLMDAVPKSIRARWKSLDAITMVGFSGSAAVGGYLSDQHGYMYSFLITALIQAVSVLMIVPLLTIVPRFEVATSSDIVVGNASGETSENGSSLQEPLLQNTTRFGGGEV